ncbi:Maf family protein [Desulfatitalea alkaliphila]|uniref:dTTP/UTP pyrophosphatase n=1 Tax=Desulfatitalea alkaliphila TaxID=2929485 RepID=A0AA41R2Y1_9BACT|nr:Maf family protein [Desulfatitalea alkaliphila]MCJ8500493.1 Maf family protein [Desulfatitalea alkaliphila]
MVHKFQQGRLILASNSPRRRYLLSRAGLSFEVLPSGVDEAQVPYDTPAAYTQTLARAKALDVAERRPDAWVIGADTIVVIDGQPLGKPRGRTAAREMLHQLSGQTHQVFTGYTICCIAHNHHVTDVVCTDVTFKSLSEPEIEWYIHTDEPFDKAGAYAIQGLGTFLVQRINGSYTNVVGLPVCEVIAHLIEAKVIRIAADGEP